MAIALARHRRRRLIIVAGAMAATMLVPSAIGAQDTGCTAQRDGDTVTLTWADNGGIHIVRRNGSWLASPGSGVDTYLDTNAPADATYLIRTWLDTESTDTDCVEGEPPPPDPPPPPPDPPPPPPDPAAAVEDLAVGVAGLAVAVRLRCSRCRCFRCRARCGSDRWRRPGHRCRRRCRPRYPATPAMSRCGARCGCHRRRSR